MNIGLSMSGGGIKALIYVGVIKALRENNMMPTVLAGLSGGAIVAGLIGSGLSEDEIIDFVEHFHFRHLVDTNPLDGFEVLDHTKVYAVLKDLSKGKNIEDCNPKVIIYATNVDTHQLEVISTGEIASAAMASSAIPPVFKPFMRDGKHLMEGGFTVMYGARYLRNEGVHFVIGSDVNGFSSVKLPGVFEATLQGLLSTMRTLEAYEKKNDPIDYEITDFHDATGMFDFSKAGRSLVEIGYRTTLRHLPEIEARIKASPQS